MNIFATALIRRTLLCQDFDHFQWFEYVLLQCTFARNCTIKFTTTRRTGLMRQSNLCRAKVIRARGRQGFNKCDLKLFSFTFSRIS